MLAKDTKPKLFSDDLWEYLWEMCPELMQSIFNTSQEFLPYRKLYASITAQIDLADLSDIIKSTLYFWRDDLLKNLMETQTLRCWLHYTGKV
jgi:hypothetical protein